jgi:branched-chain amino acid transport system permease protein
VTIFWAALSTGAIYAAVALGYNLVFVASNTFNFAQAQFVMIGTFTAYVGHYNFDIPLPVTLLIGAIAGFLLGVIEERLAIRPVAGSAHAELVTTVGASVVLEGIALKIWGSDPRHTTALVSLRPITVLGGRVVIDNLVITGICIGLVVAVTLWSKYTQLGITSLAASENKQAAQLRGINVRRLSTVTVGAAAGLGIVLGIVISSQTFAVTSLGDSLVLTAFVVLAIGGFGSYPGLLVGGLGLGLAQTYTGFYVGEKYVNIMTFLLLLLILFVRPVGLFGQRTERVI